MRKNLNKYLLILAAAEVLLMSFMFKPDSSWFIFCFAFAFIGALVYGWVLMLIGGAVEHYVLKKDYSLQYKSYYLIALVMLLLIGPFGKKSCSDHVAAYNDGYAMGEVDKASGHYAGGSVTLTTLNQNGIYPNVANDADKDCFCIGYGDGATGEKKAYEEK